MLIDSYYKNKFENFEPDISPKVWGNIKEELQQKNKKRPLIIFYRIAAIFILLIGISSIIYFTGKEANINKVFTQSSDNKQDILNSQDNSNSILNNKLYVESQLSDNQNDTTLKQDTEKITFANIEKENNLVKEKATKEEGHKINNYTAHKNHGNSSTKETILSDNQIIKDEIVQNISSPETIPNISINSNDSNFTNFIAPVSGVLIAQSLDFQLIIPESVKSKNFIYIPEIEDDTKPKSFEISLGGQFSPIFSLASEDNKISDQYFYVNPEDVNKDKVNQPHYSTTSSYSGGINLGLKKGQRLKLQLGFYYSKHEQLSSNIPVNQVSSAYIPKFSNVSANFTKDENRLLTSKLNDVYGLNRGEEILNNEYALYDLDIELKEKFGYIELPLLIKYQIVNSKIDVNLISGMNTNILIKNSAVISQNSDNLWEGETLETNKIEYKAMFGLGFDYFLTKKILFNIEPMLRYSIKETKDNNFSNPYSFALFTGLNYLF